MRATVDAVELDWLETFLAVVDRGGFAAASERVHRSQSRVSAHIAALERELGVRLIDRTRRPATLTPAGRVFARHAREIVAGVGSARSAVGAMRAMERERLAVLTTPCIGATLFPGVLAVVAEEAPGLQVVLSEQSHHDVERRFAADGIVVAVLPALTRPLAPGLQERLLWREPFRIVVRPDHPLAATTAPVPAARLTTLPVIVAGGGGDAQPEALALLAGLGLAVVPRTTVDTAPSLLALVRAGVGVGILNAVAVEHFDTDGLVVLDVGEPDMVREVAAYWYDVLVTTGVGAALHHAVLRAPVPAGGVALPIADIDGEAFGGVASAARR